MRVSCTFEHFLLIVVAVLDVFCALVPWMKVFVVGLNGRYLFCFLFECHVGYGPSLNDL